eukprot:10790471-Alexandrium_andersonii.AAC.1
MLALVTLGALGLVVLAVAWLNDANPGAKGGLPASSNRAALRTVGLGASPEQQEFAGAGANYP